MKYQVIRCTSIRDTKKSVNLRDILQIASMIIESPLSSQFGFAELQSTVLVKSKQEVHAHNSHTVTTDNFLISGCLIPSLQVICRLAQISCQCCPISAPQIKPQIPSEIVDSTLHITFSTIHTCLPTLVYIFQPLIDVALILMSAAPHWPLFAGAVIQPMV
jgi:hypothetical protein